MAASLDVGPHDFVLADEDHQADVDAAAAAADANDEEDDDEAGGGGTAGCELGGTLLLAGVGPSSSTGASSSSSGTSTSAPPPATSPTPVGTKAVIMPWVSPRRRAASEAAAAAAASSAKATAAATMAGSTDEAVAAAALPTPPVAAAAGSASSLAPESVSNLSSSHSSPVLMSSSSSSSGGLLDSANSSPGQRLHLALGGGGGTAGPASPLYQSTRTRLSPGERGLILEFLSMYLEDPSALTISSSGSAAAAATIRTHLGWRPERELVEIVGRCGDVEAVIDALLTMDATVRPKRFDEVLPSILRMQGHQQPSPGITPLLRGLHGVGVGGDHASGDSRDSFPALGLGSPALSQEELVERHAFRHILTLSPSPFQYEQYHGVVSNFLSETPLIGVVTQHELEEMLLLAGGLEPLLTVLTRWKLSDKPLARQARTIATPTTMATAEVATQHRAHASLDGIDIQLHSDQAILEEDPTGHVEAEEEKKTEAPSTSTGASSSPHADPSIVAADAEAAAINLPSEGAGLDGAPAIVTTPITRVHETLSLSAASSTSASASACAPAPSSPSVPTPDPSEPLFLSDLIARLRAHAWKHRGLALGLAPSTGVDGACSSSSAFTAAGASFASLHSHFHRPPAEITDADREDAQALVLELGLLDQATESPVVLTADLLTELVQSAGGSLFSLSTFLHALARQRNFAPQSVRELIFLVAQARSQVGSTKDRVNQSLAVQIARAKREVARQDRAAAAAAAVAARLAARPSAPGAQDDGFVVPLPILPGGSAHHLHRHRHRHHLDGGDEVDADGAEGDHVEEEEKELYDHSVDHQHHQHDEEPNASAPRDLDEDELDLRDAGALLQRALNLEQRIAEQQLQLELLNIQQGVGALEDFQDLLTLEPIVDAAAAAGLDGPALALDAADQPVVGSRRPPARLPSARLVRGLTLAQRGQIVRRLLDSRLFERVYTPADASLLDAFDLASLTPDRMGFAWRLNPVAYLCEAITILGANGVRVRSLSHLQVVLRQHYTHATPQPISAHAKKSQKNQPADGAPREEEATHRRCCAIM